MRRIVFSFFLTAVSCSGGSTTPAECDSHDDCATGEEACVNGACRTICKIQRDCDPGYDCIDDLCEPSACTSQLCPQGCCANGTCLTPSASNCGTAGAPCVTCEHDPATDSCSAAGTCVCAATGSPCASGERCSATGCVACVGGCCPDCRSRCDGASDGCGGTCGGNDCDGCCDSDRECVEYAYQTDSVCGAIGGACLSCSDASAVCDAQTHQCLATGQACALPWGGSIADGESIDAWATSTVGCGQSCTAESRTCNDGVLSGSYEHESCEAEACAPVVVYSRTLDGPSDTTFYLDEVIYGRVLNLEADNAESCLEEADVSDGFCSNPGNWTTMPVPYGDWSYDAESGRWRAVFAANTRTKRAVLDSYWRNTETGGQSPRLRITLNPRPPVPIFSLSPSGPAQTTFKQSQFVYGRVTNLEADNAQSCSEKLPDQNGLCAHPPTNWTTMPNVDWSYNAGTRLWQAKFWPYEYAQGKYRGYWRNMDTGEESAPQIITITKPDPPVMIVSTTPGGPARTSVSRSQTAYGRVLNLSASNAWSCTEIVNGPTDGTCAGNPTSDPWQHMPNVDWEHNPTLAQWRAVMDAGKYAAMTVETFWYNSDTGDQTVLRWTITD